MPLFLELDEVLQIHAYQVARFGGDAAILDIGKLESAIAQPAQEIGGQYLHPELETMAAAYLFHIVRNHPFADGNKRTGMHAAIVFLELNDCPVELPVDEAELMTLRIARGEVGKAEAAAFFKQWMRTNK